MRNHGSRHHLSIVGIYRGWGRQDDDGITLPGALETARWYWQIDRLTDSRLNTPMQIGQIEAHDISSRR